MCDIGFAIKELKKGNLLTRKWWNGFNIFVYYMPELKETAGTDWAKKHIGETVEFRACLYLKTAQGDIATWSPSTSDILADDWFVVE